MITDENIINVILGGHFVAIYFPAGLYQECCKAFANTKIEGSSEPLESPIIMSTLVLQYTPMEYTTHKKPL